MMDLLKEIESLSRLVAELVADRDYYRSIVALWEKSYAVQLDSGGGLERPKQKEEDIARRAKFLLVSRQADTWSEAEILARRLLRCARNQDVIGGENA
jgi:hypothetical protein